MDDIVITPAVYNLLLGSVIIAKCMTLETAIILLRAYCREYPDDNIKLTIVRQIGE